MSEKRGRILLLARLAMSFGLQCSLFLSLSFLLFVHICAHLYARSTLAYGLDQIHLFLSFSYPCIYHAVIANAVCPITLVRLPLRFCLFLECMFLICALRSLVSSSTLHTRAPSEWRCHGVGAPRTRSGKSTRIDPTCN